MADLLVVEDDSGIREIVKLAMEFYDEDMNVFETEHGDQALDLLTQVHVDAIVLDLYMPVRDGFEVLEMLREEVEWTELPIVVLTAGGPEDVLRAWNAGADYVVEKPFPLSSLIDTVDRALTEPRQHVA